MLLARLSTLSEEYLTRRREALPDITEDAAVPVCGATPLSPPFPASAKCQKRTRSPSYLLPNARNVYGRRVCKILQVMVSIRAVKLVLISFFHCPFSWRCFLLSLRQGFVTHHAPNLPVSLALSRVSIPVSLYTFPDPPHASVPHPALSSSPFRIPFTCIDISLLCLFIMPVTTCTIELMDLTFCRS
jgi:hypothetical protein